MSLRQGLVEAAVCVVAVCLAQGAYGQSKIGVVSMQTAVLGTAEIKKASSDMEAKYLPRASKVDSLTKTVNDLSTKLNSGKLADAEAATVNADLARKQRELTRLQDDLKTDSDNERNEILSRCLERMTGVVKKLAEEKGIDMVVDNATTVVYAKPALDLTTDAVAAYDKQYPAGSSSAAPASKKK
jgi:outer membrane protein